MGNPVPSVGTLNQAAVTSTTGQINVTGVGNNTIAMGLILGGDGSGQQAVSVGTSSTLLITGTISNASGVGDGWAKTNINGSGLLTLSPTSGLNTFNEAFTVNTGAGRRGQIHQ